jgi:ubiquinone/menaquinone biosynthesis C-methylase UbiE
MTGPEAATSRSRQLEYSELQSETKDETKRRQKATKIAAVLQHFLGRDDLSGLTAIDIGCSTGYTADTLRAAGAEMIGLDIDAPGLAYAIERFGGQTSFVCADGSALPFPDHSVDLVVFNHIYEHVVEPEAVMAEIRRVLRPDGVAYFGFANRLGIIEPHYRLPFLSWLPRKAADRYVAMTGRAPEYYEHLRTRPSLRKMARGFSVWDYTYTVLSDSAKFHAADLVPPRLADAPPRLWRLAAPIMPTFIWVATPGDLTPAGEPTRQAPRRLAG